MLSARHQTLLLLWKMRPASAREQAPSRSSGAAACFVHAINDCISTYDTRNTCKQVLYTNRPGRASDASEFLCLGAGTEDRRVVTVTPSFRPTNIERFCGYAAARSTVETIDIIRLVLARRQDEVLFAPVTHNERATKLGASVRGHPELGVRHQTLACLPA